jgi:RNA-directed DNA polymerase
MGRRLYLKSVEELVSSLYQTAKADKNRRFYSLHDKVCRMDVLEEAWRRVKQNHGVCGVDEQTIEDIENSGVEQFLGELQRELQLKTYRIQCVKRVFIPKRSGGMRPLGIPTVRGRVVQQAVRLIVEPIFEADFAGFSYGYRSGRSAKQATAEICKWLNFGLTNVVDVDIKGFFDHVNHGKLLSFVGERVADGYVLKLVKEWLRAGVVHLDSVKYPNEGTPQGGVISSLLANIYLNKLDRCWVELGMNRRDKKNAQMVRYADDIVILTDCADVGSIWGILVNLLGELGLELSVEKSRVTTAEAGFEFLSFHFFRKFRAKKGKVVSLFFPSKSAVLRFKDKVRVLTSKCAVGLKDEEELALELNRLIVGWSSYFNCCDAFETYKRLQRFIEWKFAKFMFFKHQWRRFSFRYGGLWACYRYGLGKLGGAKFADRFFPKYSVR